MHDRPSLSRREFLGCTVTAAGLGAAGLSAAAGPAGAAAPAKAEAAATAPAAGWQIGCYTRPWDKHEYTTALDAIAAAGYRYVGLMTTKSAKGLVVSVDTPAEEARQIGRQCAKRGLKVASVYGGDIPVAKGLEAAVEGLRRLIDACAAAGAADLLMGGTGNEKLQDAYYNAIAACCPYAAEKGMGMSVKPHGGLNATGPQCRKLIERVGKPNFRIWYDPGNILYYSDGKLDPVADAASVDGLVAGMSVKDYRHPKNVAVTPGTGQVDFPAVMARLKKGGFTAGPLIVECLAPGDLDATLAEAKKAREFLDKLVGQKA